MKRAHLPGLFFFCVIALSIPCAGERDPAAVQPEHPRESLKFGFLKNGVTAHRGDSGAFPGNTMPAFISGIDSGADWLELDILRTRDGKLVVIHDRTTGRVGDRDISVLESTYEELLQVDVAAVFRERNGFSRSRVPPERAPLLEDVLRLVMSQSRTRVSIQPKMNCVAETIELVRKMKAEKWVGFNDVSLDLMSEVKRLAPEIPVFWDRRTADLKADIPIARKHGFESLVLNKAAMTPAIADTLKSEGFEVGVWTVNEPEDWSRFLDMGVDRIYTDFPRELLQLKGCRDFESLRAVDHVSLTGSRREVLGQLGSKGTGNSRTMENITDFRIFRERDNRCSSEFLRDCL